MCVTVLNSLATELTNGVTALNSLATELTNSVTALNSLATELTSGVTGLSSPATELTNGVTVLNSLATELHQWLPLVSATDLSMSKMNMEWARKETGDFKQCCIGGSCYGLSFRVTPPGGGSKVVIKKLSSEVGINPTWTTPNVLLL